MNYKEAFERLERENQQKEYQINLYRRNSSNFFIFLVLVVSLFLVFVMLTLQFESDCIWLLFGIEVALVLFLHSLFNEDKLRRELK